MQLRKNISAIGLQASLAFAILPAAALLASQSFGTSLKLGPLSQHMLDHIALLGIAAPLSAWALRNHLPQVSGRMLATAATAQIVLIWLWHLPPVFDIAAQGATSLHVAMIASLYLAGLMFWCAIVGLAERRLWQAVLALLVTGKLFCLFAAVLVFSPRVLYHAHAGDAHHAAHAALNGLDDQHLAGLIMIAVCPLTYVAAGVAVAARWFSSLEARYPDIRRPLATLNSPLIVALLLLALLPGCGTVQSTLVPASPEASTALRLTWILFIGGTMIFVFVMALAAVAILGGDRVRGALGSTQAIALGGIVFPTVVLSSLLIYGLWLATASAAPTRAEQEIAVQGERWWWRVTYADPETTALASANEIRVEVGRPVRLKLTSPDVIHSFWVPALAGKVDLIPGRTNELRFTASRAGTYRGQCAEYCGGPHAMMALRVVAMEPADYAAWLAAERQPATDPTSPQTVRGQEVFRAHCIACHAVRGTEAGGRLGPDLTHVASRGAIGGEVLATSEQNIAQWLTDNDRLKPNNLMPEYRHLPSDDLAAVSAYIASLK